MRDINLKKLLASGIILACISIASYQLIGRADPAPTQGINHVYYDYEDVAIDSAALTDFPYYFTNLSERGGGEHRAGIIDVTVKNTGAGAIDGFALRLKNTPKDDWYTIIPTADWSTTTYVLLYSENPADIDSNGGVAHFRVRTGSAWGVAFQLASTNGAAEIDVHAAIGYE